MNQSEEREREIAELRDRLSRLTEASLRINGSVCLRSTSLESPYDYWGRYTQSKRNPRFVYRLQLRSKPVLNPHGKPSPEGLG